MGELEDRLNAVLSDPKMMENLMRMAQSLSSQAKDTLPPPPPEESKPAAAPSGPPTAAAPSGPPAAAPVAASAAPKALPPGLDLGTLQKLSGLASQGQLDRNQRDLLRALGPYLSKERLNKLERAMRAAKMAQFASTALGRGAPIRSGR